MRGSPLRPQLARLGGGLKPFGASGEDFAGGVGVHAAMPMPTMRSGQALRKTSVLGAGGVVAGSPARRCAPRERRRGSGCRGDHDAAPAESAGEVALPIAPSAVSVSGATAGAIGASSFCHAVQIVAAAGARIVAASSMPTAPRRRAVHPSATTIRKFTAVSSRKSIESAKSETLRMAAPRRTPAEIGQVGDPGDQSGAAEPSHRFQPSCAQSAPPLMIIVVKSSPRDAPPAFSIKPRHGLASSSHR